MYRVIECLTQEHHHGLVAIAALVCIVGSVLTAQIARRLMAANGQRKKFQLFLTSLLFGATIWSTHFIAMLAYDPGYVHGYDPLLTALSFIVAIFGVFGAMAALAYLRSPWNYLAGGSMLGGSVSAMHYAGMLAYLLPGRLVWDPTVVAVSVALGAALGIVAFHRLVSPFTRYCWVGAAVLMVLAICAMHFTGMTAFTIELSPLVSVPPQVLPDDVLAVMTFCVTALILFTGFMGISIEKNLEREALALIDETAKQDALTGLPNRLMFSQRIQHFDALLARDTTQRLAVLTIDLNRFKEVNDLHGHAAGDVVLVETAQRLSRACSSDEFVARTGGDEFIALKSGFRRVDEVKAFAQRIHALIIEPFTVQGMQLTIGAAIGIATSVDDGTDVDELMQKSDLAMYRAKADPGRAICFFNAEMDQQNRERLLLINDLRQAVARDEFELAYQLQNDTGSRAPCGVEVLLRWTHPDRGPVSPGEFIPLAEETGLIREIGLWVLRAACREAVTWSEPYAIAVNVAPQQLAQPSFVEHISDILMETGLPPERLELEVTEASIIDDQVHTLQVMHKIKSMGVRIAMDDFGTGYSSLATLQAFPFDKIKIDRSFIQNVHNDTQRAAIVRSTLLLGDALEIPVLAEGVENECELNFLKQERCRYVQGFLFGKPMNAENLRKAMVTLRKSIAS
jgi:diguanylate cyclase (GGDEF)-like protein